jgi:dipeptidyl aminopeptidase/acylaminoacyl peptidase
MRTGQAIATFPGGLPWMDGLLGAPDGKRIVFSRRLDEHFQVFVMNHDATRLRQLTDAAGDFTNPRWSPDGKEILRGRRLGGTSLVVFNAPN